MDEIDTILDDLTRTHIIVNAEAGHGKSSSVQTIIKRLRDQEPKTIIKCFDVSQAWFHRAPLPRRQRINVEKLEGNRWRNVNNCVYEMGELNDELRRWFVALVVKQDYDSRKQMGYECGLDAVKKLPRVVYIFEESDVYFSSTALNKKDPAADTLRDFIKVGRNFGLRGICIVTAAVGELGTKFRRRSKHLIGHIISPADRKAYNSFVKGLGDKVAGLPRFNWIYYNGKVSKIFNIPDVVESIPKDYYASVPMVVTPKKKTGVPMWAWVGLAILIAFLIGVAL